MKIGIDFGRVIVGPTIDGKDDTSFIGTQLAEALTTPAAPDAFDVVRELWELTQGNVWIVSKAGPSVQRKSRAWLHHLDFFAVTGMPEEHLRFCLHRHEKALHARELGLTHFIDDRTDVLAHLDGIVPHRLLFGEQTEPAPPDLEWVKTWQDVRNWFGVETRPTDSPSDRVTGPGRGAEP
jgi:hypothetical protein